MYISRKKYEAKILNNRKESLKYIFEIKFDLPMEMFYLRQFYSLRNEKKEIVKTFV